MIVIARLEFELTRISQSSKLTTTPETQFILKTMWFEFKETFELFYMHIISIVSCFHQFFFSFRAFYFLFSFHIFSNVFFVSLYTLFIFRLKNLILQNPLFLLIMYSCFCYIVYNVPE